jgi:hypothetical protein
MGRPNPALEPTTASARSALAVPLSLRSSAAAQRDRYAAFHAARRIQCDGRYGQKPALAAAPD